MDIPSAMGYDRAITVFSPDGRLLQVEYARKTVSQGTLVVGIVYKNGVVLAADKRIIEKLMVPESVEKIVKVDDHIGASMSGLISDGRVLIEKAQEIAQKHKVTYDEPISPLSLVKEICSLKQVYTQIGGARPFGVSLLVAGVNEKPNLFVTEPSGIFFEYKATAIGENAESIIPYLESKYKDNLSKEDAIILGLSAIKKALKNKFSKKRIEVAVVEKGKNFEKIKNIEKYMKKI